MIYDRVVLPQTPSPESEDDNIVPSVDMPTVFGGELDIDGAAGNDRIFEGQDDE